MQDSSEALVLEEHQISDPPLMSQQVRLCITFFVRLCITFSDLVLEETQIGNPPLPPNVHVHLLTLAYIYILYVS